MRNFPHRHHRDVVVPGGDSVVPGGGGGGVPGGGGGTVAYGVGACDDTQARIHALPGDDGDAVSGTCTAFRNHQRCRGTDWLIGRA